MSHARPDDPHFVYRAFDSYGHLLYIGCTNNPDKRLATHRSQAPWFRFAETISVAGPYAGRSAGRAVETQAILTEGAYFNCTMADIKRTQANINAAKRSLHAQGWFSPRYEIEDIRDLSVWEAEYERLRPEQEAWDRGFERERERFKAGAYPYMTDADRMARYLVARQDAELARSEAAA
jgi:hypothetical protein